jgi:hypothetical protein
MVKTPKRPSQLDSPLIPKIFRYVGRAHVWVYRRTRGRIGGKWRIGAAFRKPVPTLLLEHEAASPANYSSPRCSTWPTAPTSLSSHRRGTTRAPAVVPQPGQPPRHPYRDRRRSPCGQSGYGRSGERARLWPRLVDVYADFDHYQSWTDREIPVVVLQPR